VSKTTLRPVSYVSAGTGGSATVVGAASAVAAVSDDSDGSYLESSTYKGDVFGLTDPELPTSAIVKAVTGRLRMYGVPGEVYTPYANLFLTLDGKALAAGTFSPPSLATYQIFSTTVTQAQVPTVKAGSLRLEAASTQMKIYEVYLDLTYVEQPKTEVTAPAGTVENTNRPVVSWLNTLDADGGAQTFYEVRVFSQGTYEAEGFSPSTSVADVGSEVVSGSVTSWTPSDTLADGDYRAYVRVAQTVGESQMWSDWAYGGFSVEVALPARPALTLTRESDSARIRLTIEEGEEGAATTEGFEVQWSHDAETWTDLRTEEGGGLAAGTAVTLYDYEAPNGWETGYRVRAWHEYDLGSRAWSDWVIRGATWESSDRWLKHPTNPELNVKVEPYSYPGSTRAGRVGNFQPLGREDAVLVSDTRLARKGSLVLWVDDEDAQEALDAILATLDPLLLQMAPQDRRKDRWMVLGTVERAPIVDKLTVSDTLETLEWVETARP
jgi:hypothetical protein